jgi:hypothetical protein
MPQFSWEPLDFLEALEVVPIEEEYDISYRYLLAKAPITLDLTIWPLTGDVALFLACEGVAEPLVHLNLLESPGERVVRGGQGTFLEFAAAKLFEGRYDYRVPPPYGFRLQVQPFIQVSPFSYPQ